MFNLLRETIVKEDQIVFDLALKPYIIYTIINSIIIELANNNIGILNEDVAYGLIGSWAICGIVMLLIILIWDIKRKELDS